MSNRIKGTALGLTIGGVDYWVDITSALFDNEEASSDVTTFADAAAGGARQHFVTIGAVQSTQTGSFWRMVWANSGSEAAYKYAAHGNAVATADEPHLIGTLKIGPKPPLGGSAGTSSTYSFETRFDINGEPELDQGTGADPVISAISPTGRAEGEPVVISGTRFTGVSGVTFDGDAVDFVFVSDSTISAVVAGEGTVPVIVTTAEGASAAFDYAAAE